MSRISLFLAVVSCFLYMASAQGSIRNSKFQTDSGCPRLDSAYTIKGYKSGYCLASRSYANNADLYITSCGQNKYTIKDFRWTDKDNSDLLDLFGWYALVDNASGKCVTVNKDGGSTKDNMVYLYTCAPQAGRENQYQLWAFTPSKWGASYGYVLMNHASGRCLAVYAGSTSSGSGFTIDECHLDWYNQMFIFNEC